MNSKYLLATFSSILIFNCWSRDPSSFAELNSTLEMEMNQITPKPSFDTKAAEEATTTYEMLHLSTHQNIFGDTAKRMYERLNARINLNKDPSDDLELLRDGLSVAEKLQTMGNETRLEEIRLRMSLLKFVNELNRNITQAENNIQTSFGISSTNEPAALQIKALTLEAKSFLKKAKPLADKITSAINGRSSRIAQLTQLSISSDRSSFLSIRNIKKNNIRAAACREQVKRVLKNYE